MFLPSRKSIKPTLGPPTKDTHQEQMQGMILDDSIIDHDQATKRKQAQLVI